MLNGNLLCEYVRYWRRNLNHILDNFIIYPLQVIWVQSVHYFSWLEGFTEWHHNSLNARFWYSLQKWTSLSTQNREKYAAYEIFLVSTGELYFLYKYVKSCKKGFIINGDTSR